MKKIPKEYGIITSFIAWFFRILQKLPPQVFIGNRTDSFTKSKFQTSSPEQRKAETIRRSRLIDIYILCCLLTEILCLIISQTHLGESFFLKAFIRLLVILRLIDIIQVNINLSLFDFIRTGKPSNYMASVVRTIINVVINYFEMILCFGILYHYQADQLSNITTWSDPFYFSIISQMTLGFGEIMPTGSLKLLTSLQFVLGYFFTALIIARFISLLPQGKTIAGDSQSDE